MEVGERLEQLLGCRLFPDLTFDQLKAVPIEQLQQLYRRELEMIILLERLTQDGAAAADVGRVLQTHQFHGRERPGTHREIAGLPMKAICSNIRRQDVDWNQYEGASSGVGNEGDIVIARALGDTGSTVHVEDQQGREVRLFAGDHFMGVLGNRHSSTSEYGNLPKGLPISVNTQLDLLCYGGILGQGVCVPNTKSTKTFFAVQIAALLKNGDRNLSLQALYPEWDQELLPSAPIIFNCGTAAEIGKTTSSSSIIRALKRRGLKVGATKLAGTGRFRDLLALRDSGADAYYDFPDVGLASTYTSATRTYYSTVSLLNKLNREQVDVIVAEMGGDIIEANIPRILQDEEIMKSAAGIIHSSSDVLGIIGSLQQYKAFRVNAPIKLTLPKDRNNAGTRERLKQRGLFAFNTLNDEDCDRIVEELTRGIS